MKEKTDEIYLLQLTKHKVRLINFVEEEYDDDLVLF